MYYVIGIHFKIGKKNIYRVYWNHPSTSENETEAQFVQERILGISAQLSQGGMANLSKLQIEWIVW